MIRDSRSRGRALSAVADTQSMLLALSECRTADTEYFPILSHQRSGRLGPVIGSTCSKADRTCRSARSNRHFSGPVARRKINKLRTVRLKSQPSQAIVTFGDGSHAVALRRGATLADLAEYIDDLGAHYDGTPLSIDIVFNAPSSRSMVRSHPRRSIVH